MSAVVMLDARPVGRTRATKSLRLDREAGAAVQGLLDAHTALEREAERAAWDAWLDVFERYAATGCQSCRLLVALETYWNARLAREYVEEHKGRLRPFVDTMIRAKKARDRHRKS